VNKVQQGKATLADLTKGGATQLSPAASCTAGYPGNFPASGQWTPVLGSSPPSPGVYAVSIPGVHPSTCTTWFQAAQACRLAGKRLLTNLEWQDAAAGTPDPGTDNGTSDCNIFTAGDAVNTGSRANCKSSWGVFDMVGNVNEWVADWADLSTGGCTNSTTAFGFPGSDLVCFGGNGSPQVPGALFRGGSWGSASAAGVFTVDAFLIPSASNSFLGFRCAR
jgi:formylglycine-generating enzyme required for sulfatase activity